MATASATFTPIPTFTPTPTFTEVIPTPAPSKTPSQVPSRTITLSPTFAEITPGATITPSAVKTYTAAPPISRLEAAVTRAFANPELFSRAKALASMNGTYNPTIFRTQIAMLASNQLAGDLIKSNMSITGIPDEMPTYATDPRFVAFNYRYWGDESWVAERIDSRIGQTLCALREAGFRTQAFGVHVNLFTRSGQSRYTRMFCISPDVVAALNCDSPETTRINDLPYADLCPLI